MTRPRFHKNKILFRQITRSIDLILCSFLITLAIIIPYRKDQRIIAFGVAAFFGVFGIALLFDRRSRKRKEMARRRATAREIQLEKLMLIPDADLKCKLKEPNLFIIRDKTIRQESAFAAIRSHLPVIACIGEAGEVEELFRRYAPKTKVLTLSELIDRIQPTCSDAEIRERLRPENRHWISFRTVLRNVSEKKYLLLGIVLYALSFFVKYNLYYRLIGSACFALSALSVLFRKKVRD